MPVENLPGNLVDVHIDAGTVVHVKGIPVYLKNDTLVLTSKGNATLIDRKEEAPEVK